MSNEKTSVAMVSLKCPICEMTVVWEANPNRPFCSERCRLFDLGNWASSKYVLPIEEPEVQDDPEQESGSEI